MRNGARRTRRTGLQELPGVVVNSGALIPTLPPSSSRAFRSPGCNRLIVRAFTTTLAASTSAVFDPTSGPKFVRCSNRESRGPGRRMDGRSGLHHTGLPNYAKGENGAPSLTPFVCCLTVSAKLRPTVHAGGLRHKPSQQVVVCWHHTPSLINLTCPYDDVHCTLCSTVGLWVTISGRLLHNIACPSQLHRPQ